MFEEILCGIVLLSVGVECTSKQMHKSFCLFAGWRSLFVMIIQLLHISCIVAGLKENNVDCMIISLEIYSLYPYMQIKNDHVLQCIYIFSRFN